MNQHLVEEKPKKRSKYNNVKVEFDGHQFDSQKECNHYIVLRARLKAEEITDLRLQVEYELNEGGSHSLKYIADFVYLENGIVKVVDVKGYRTAIYKKKCKLMEKVHGIEIIEI